jgi:hypothetical protein
VATKAVTLDGTLRRLEDAAAVPVLDEVDADGAA